MAAGVATAWTKFFNAVANALTRPWPERRIDYRHSALETQPWVIWPSRYHDPVTHEFIDRTQMMRQKEDRQVM
ncbi:helix-turn-helix domain-containing protein [Klebsiella pneumoniae]|nr:helix-turn-helix domain-containing protein [Klebsiella pneumoniae]